MVGTINIYKQLGLYHCDYGFHSYRIDILKASINYHYNKTSLHDFFEISCAPKYNSIEGYNLKNNPVIMHCVIPAGTRYAVNKYGEYVSESIEVKSFENLPFVD